MLLENIQPVDEFFLCRRHQESAGESGSNVQNQAGLGRDQVTQGRNLYILWGPILQKYRGCLGWLLRWWLLLVVTFMLITFANYHHHFFGGVVIEVPPLDLVGMMRALAYKPFFCIQKTSKEGFHFFRGGCFKYVYIFIPIWGRFPFWLILSMTTWRIILFSKFLPSPPLIKHEWPFGRGTLPHLKDKNSPWLLTTYPSLGMILQAGRALASPVVQDIDINPIPQELTQPRDISIWGRVHDHPLGALFFFKAWHLWPRAHQS